MKNSFEERYRTLNSEQKRAVDAIDGPVMVIAGPGTGKTTVLTLRIANILKRTDTPPDAILALTFTESGVRSMRRKLTELIGPSAYRIKIYTFHGFAHDIIKTYPDKFPRIIGAEHMEDLEQLKIVEDILEKADFEMLRPKNDPTFYVEKIISAIKDLKRDNIDPEKFSKLVKNQEEAIRSVPDLYHEKGKYAGKMKGDYATELEKIEKNKELCTVYKAYEKALEEKHLYDYEDMIMEVVRTLEKNKNLLLHIQEENQYILADEHQDANDAQNKLLELISSFHENPNLFIVGDEKQAIFRFQGASLENFLYFKKKFKDAVSIALTDNYRSTQSILDSAHALIANNTVSDEALRVRLSASSKHTPEKIKIAALDDRESESSFVSKEIKRLVDSGTRPSDIAVLVRNNSHAESIERTLLANGIPVAKSADTDALNDPYISSFVSFLELLSHPSKPELLGKALFFGFLGIDPIDASKILEKARKEKMSLVDAVKTSSELAGFYKKLSHLSRIASNEPAVKGFDAIVRESGFFEFILKHSRAHELFSLYDGLLQTVIRFAERRKAATLNDFVSELLKAGEYNKDILVSKIPPDGVELMTAHGSKGLEFDYVFIVNVNEGVWSGKRVHKAFLLPTGGLKDAVEDERRLFYVSLTRARKGVWITYAKRGADEKDISPSRFIYEMGENLEEIESVLHARDVRVKENKEEEKDILIKDKAYLNKLFIERGFPVTHLNNFLKCPWKYFFIDLLRVPAPQEDSALYGSAMHNALKDYFNAYAREEDITLDKAVELFESYLRRTHMSEKDAEVFAKSGREELRKYLSQGNFTRAIFNEFAVTGVPFKVGNVEIILNGKLDKVEVLGGGGVNVVDYKTGKPKSRNEIMGETKNADGDYYRQLIFYKLLLDVYKRGEWNMKTGTIDFIKPDDKGKIHREIFVIEDKEVEGLKSLIKETAQKILDLSFAGGACDKQNCEWCRLAKAFS